MSVCLWRLVVRMPEMQENFNLTQDELDMFEACSSAEEWNAACVKVKKARGGAYPPDWWTTMKISGRMDRILAKFGESSEIRLVPISD